jgi:hypothetical protein
LFNVIIFFSSLLFSHQAAGVHRKGISGGDLSPSSSSLSSSSLPLSSIVQKKFICVSNRIGNNQQRTWMQASHVIEEGHAIPTWGAGRVRGEEG